MFNCFFPDEYLDSTYVINFDDLYAQGYRGLLFDIDNTLVPHGAPADERACALFAHLKELGFKCCFLSNNQYERVSSFNDRSAVYRECTQAFNKKLYQGNGTSWDRQK